MWHSRSCEAAAAFPCRRRLPLPLLEAPDGGALFVGVVIDDSLFAYHGTAAGTRFAVAAARLRASLADLPTTARIAFAPTSFAKPTRFMNRTDAVLFLDSMRPLPRVGDADAALRALLKELRGHRGAVVIAAPRAAVLWAGLRELAAPAAGAAPIQYLDTTEVRAAAILGSVAPAAGAGPGRHWICHLRGTPEALQGKVLRLLHGQDVAAEIEVSLADALRQRVDFEWRREPGSGPLVLALQEEYAHDWFQWYVDAAAAGVRRRPQVVLFRDQTEASLLTDRILTAALLAAAPGLRLHRVDPQVSGAAKLPDATVAVIVGSPPRYPAFAAWLRDQLAAGLRVLCVPVSGLAEGDRAEPGPGAEFLPSWGRETVLVAGAVRPLQVTSGGSQQYALESLLPAGLDDMPCRVVIAPRFRGGGTALLTTSTGFALMVETRAGDYGRVLALAFPVTLAPESPVFHPVFPLLLKRLLMPREAAVAGAAPSVGDSVDLGAWFGVDTVVGTLQKPAADPVSVQWSRRQPLQVYVDAPGPYRLKTREQELVRYANARRAPESRVFSRAEWAAARPGWDTVWRRPEQPMDLGRSGAFAPVAADSDTVNGYDLSALFLGLLAACLAIEGALLVRNSRKPGSAA